MVTDSLERWRQVSALFDEAVMLPPERRAEFLKGACGGDADLERRVAELLEASGRGSGFLALPLVLSAFPNNTPSSAPTATAPPGDAAHEGFGPYHLLQKIGEGGMGEVWLAEQGEPIRRRVALKLIKSGMDSRQIVARFEAERQALALMDHPSIAKVFDAGATPRGLPYFAMEYVQGEPITVYCDRQRLTIRERLELVIQVCEAVQHAHQKGIIHRDLKPSNVLVTIQGGRPVPKVIDFGVAKATAQRLTEKTLYTELGVLIGTPEYMSPEQAEMTGLDVDTRTDVYALGVTLYEILTGTLPFAPQDLRAAGFDEIRRRIREVDPPRPSTKVRSLGKASTESAHRRRTEPGKLVSRLKGDLDWITMKALEKDRTRRYGSPNELAADIARHLHQEPVLAGPPRATYRAGKFVRRHRLGVAMAAAGVVALVGFAGTMAVQARRIARERNRAERVSEFLTDLFKVSDPRQSRGNTITAREILDKGAGKIEKDLATEPELQAQLMLTMGWVYAQLGLYEKAEPMFLRSVETRRRILGEDDPETLTAVEGLAFLYERQGRYAEAEKLGSGNVEVRRRVLGREHRETLFSMERLAVVYERQIRYDEALKLQLEVLEARRRVLPENDHQTVWSMQNVAAMYMLLGRHDEAQKRFREAYEIRLRALGPDNPDTLWIKNNLGETALGLRKYDEAEKIFIETLEARRRVLGPDHPDTLISLRNLGVAADSQGRNSEAEGLYRQAYEGRRRVLGEDHADTISAKANLADIAAEQGRLEEAEKTYLEVLEARRRVLGPENRRTIAIVNNLGNVLYDQKRYEEAEKLYRQALEVNRRALGPDHPNTLIAINNLGAVCAEMKRYDEAEQFLQEALDGATRVHGRDHASTLSTHIALAGVVALRGRRLQAFDMLRQAVEAGYRDADGMLEEPTLRSLHGDPEFERLVAAVRENGTKKPPEAR